MSRDGADLIVVGAGIVGLAHALAAAKAGKRVMVIDRDHQANGASIRNFGFVTVTGQASGAPWQRARRSRDIWLEVAHAAGIAIEQTGLLMTARRSEAVAVLEAFMQTAMAEGCELVGAVEARARWPMLVLPDTGAVLHSTVDLRVESRSAIPRVAQYLAEVHGVAFVRGVAVTGVASGQVETTAGVFLADAIAVCPGDDLVSLFADALAPLQLTRCRLQMMRLAAPSWRLPCPVMSDLGLGRYLGYAELPEAAGLKRRLAAEQADELAHGIHLIAVRSSDGSLVVGDSHHYAPTPDPFTFSAVDGLILREFEAVLGPPPAIVERWSGTYASGPHHSVVLTPFECVRVVVVTSGTGASTGFALGEDVVADLCGLAQGNAT
jgi:FAD dependent oxidoreductase TIGR03364